MALFKRRGITVIYGVFLNYRNLATVMIRVPVIPHPLQPCNCQCTWFILSHRAEAPARPPGGGRCQRVCESCWAQWRSRRRQGRRAPRPRATSTSAMRTLLRVRRFRSRHILLYERRRRTITVCWFLEHVFRLTPTSPSYVYNYAYCGVMSCCCTGVIHSYIIYYARWSA